MILNKDGNVVIFQATDVRDKENLSADNIDDQGQSKVWQFSYLFKLIDLRKLEMTKMFLFIMFQTFSVRHF